MSLDFWTPERVATLEKLFAQGLSCRLIAREIGGCTRNAVIGKLHRMRMKRDLPSMPHRIRYGMAEDTHAGRRRPEGAPRPKPKPKRQRQHNNLAGVNTERRARSKGRPMEPLVPVLVEVTRARPWLERGFGQCAYPVSGEGADVMSCCNPTDATYCAGHAAVMFRPAPNNAERLIKWGVRYAA